MFNRLKQYISNLEYLEKLFLMYEDLEYSHEKLDTKNLCMYLIKKEYRRVYKRIKNKNKPKEMSYFESKSRKMISKFLKKYKLDRVKFLKEKYEFNGEKADNQIYRLFLYEALRFGWRYFRIVNYEIYKKINKNTLQLDNVLCNENTPHLANENDTVLCMSCMKEIKSTLLKYHLEGKKHKRLGGDNVIRIKGDLAKTKHLINKIIKYADLEEKCDQENYQKNIKEPKLSKKNSVDDIEEFEDQDGNVYDKETYFDLKRNGLL